MRTDENDLPVDVDEFIRECNDYKTLMIERQHIINEEMDKISKRVFDQELNSQP